MKLLNLIDELKQGKHLRRDAWCPSITLAIMIMGTITLRTFCDRQIIEPDNPEWTSYLTLEDLEADDWRVAVEEIYAGYREDLMVITNMDLENFDDNDQKKLAKIVKNILENLK